MRDLLDTLIFLAMACLGVLALGHFTSKAEMAAKAENRAECEAKGGTYIEVMDHNRTSFDSCALPKQS